MGATIVRQGDRSAKATSLRYVGPATAAVIERAPFDADDIRNARVSHRVLIEAGVNHGVAEHLRREYRLLWDFHWHPGDVNLLERAAKMRGASAAERRWIAAAAENWDGRLPGVAGSEEAVSDDPESVPEIADWPEWPDVSEVEGSTNRLHTELGGGTASDSACPRCDGELTSFQMGEQQSRQCSACGYVGIQLASHANAWRRAVDRVVRGPT